MVGQVFTAGAAWALLSAAGASWRLFAGVCTIPAAAAALLIAILLPESPRYLLNRGNVAGAAAATAYVGTVSRRPAWATIADQAAWVAHHTDGVRGWRLHTLTDGGGGGGGGDSGGDGSPTVHSSVGGSTTTRCRCRCAPRRAAAECRNLAADMASQLAAMFSAPLRSTSGFLMAVWFCLSFGWYGLLLWIPTLFHDANLGLDAYQDSFLVSAANLPGNLAAALLMDRIGRKNLLVGSLIGACAAAILFAFATTKTLVILAASLLNAISVGSWNALDCLSTESFPTSLRTSSVGFRPAAARIGSMVARRALGALGPLPAPAGLTRAAAVRLPGALCGWRLPHDTAGAQLVADVAHIVGPAGTPAAAAAAAADIDGGSGGSVDVSSVLATAEVGASSPMSPMSTMPAAVSEKLPLVLRPAH